MKIIVCGSAGRMGRVLSEKIENSKGLCVACGVDVTNAVSASYPLVEDINDFDGYADVVVDFSHHSQTEKLCSYAVRRGIPMVIATTGQTEEENAIIKKAAESVAVFKSANMSLGVAVLCELARRAAAVLEGADIEILEKHHNKKLDAPSGTALLIADEIKSVLPEKEYVYDRSGRRAERDVKEIGIQSVRAGNIVGEHEILFALGNEHITISHSALNRGLFADGAISAAKFIIGKSAGLYDMKSLLAD